MKGANVFLLVVVAMISLAGAVSAELVATSQMGYHPSSHKQVIVYTDDASGSFSIVSLSGGTVYTGALVKARDNAGNIVECQGNNPCLVGDFSNLSSEGNYKVVVAGGSNQPTFSISDEIYEDNVPALIEFFDAQKQQDSSYHADMHSGYSPGFTIIADGSFIMESHQAAKTLIRLGSAYNRNPEMFAGTEISEDIRDYTDYIISLQGLEIETMNPGEDAYEDGFRLDRGVKIENAFVPGPTNMSTLEVYSEGENPALTDTVEVVSLCGEDDGSSTWQDCIDYAEQYYKCQVDEVCLNSTYIEHTGKVVGKSGYGVATGWSTEFGCYFDVDTNDGVFNNEMNPCLVFDESEEESGTVQSLLAMLEAVPAIYDIDEGHAEEVYLNSVNTYEWIKAEYGTSRSEEDVGYWGAALFLLYDYSGDEKYLNEAYSLRNEVPRVFVADETRGNEFYWEEYARHRTEIESIGTYTVGGKNPEEFFEDKMFYDWKDRGATSISKNGERIFQFDNNIRFQNSRFILTEGVLASKSADLNNDPEQFVDDIADNQLSWMTGMNAVQEGTGLNAPVRSYSFIFGIAQSINPEEFHSRYLVDTGYLRESGGDIVGARGSGKQFYNGTDYIYLDGVTHVLGKDLGSLGNTYLGEEQTDLWAENVRFENGKDYISGWINGAFDISEGGEDDTIFNYDDTRETYEFTESTNEMVATAIEFFSYRDALYNSREARNFEGFDIDTPSGTGELIVNSTPAGANVHVDSVFVGLTPLNITVDAGTRSVSVSLEGYETMSQSVFVSNGSVENLDFVLNAQVNESNNEDNSNSGGSSSGGGGGGGGGSSSPQFSVNSVSFSDESINLAKGERQTLRVEADISRGEISSVSGLIVGNGANFTVQLGNVNGNRWEAEIEGLDEGIYSLREITLASGTRESKFSQQLAFGVVNDPSDFEELGGDNNENVDLGNSEGGNSNGRSLITGKAIGDYFSGAEGLKWSLIFFGAIVLLVIVAAVVVRKIVKRKRTGNSVEI